MSGIVTSGASAVARSLDDVLRTRPMTSTLRNFELLSDNQQFIQRLVRDIDQAEHHVSAWMFSWQPDGAGVAVRDALRRAAARGVDVDVVVDGLASRQAPFTGARRFLDEVVEAGGEVQRNWPVRREGLSLRLNGSDHVKLFEIDGRTAWTGGRNLADKYDEWHDFMVRFEGQAASVLGAEQAARFRELGGTVASSRMQRLRDMWHAQAGDDAAESVRLLRTDPKRGMFEARDEIFRRIANATDEVTITTPYFGSDEAAKLLSDAARRGVDTTVMVPGPNQWKNGQYAIHATRSYYPALEGARVLEFPFMSHAKANVIDGAGMIGTVNIGRRALQIDQELMLAFEAGSPASRTIARQLADDAARAAAPPAGAGDERLPRLVRTGRRLTGIEQ